jgi:hypothetical protein
MTDDEEAKARWSQCYRQAGYAVIGARRGLELEEVAVRVRSGLRLVANVSFRGGWIEEHPRIIVVDGLPVLVTPGSAEDMLAMLLAGPVTEAIRGLIADEPWREDAVVPVEFSEVEDVWWEAFASAPSAANGIDVILAPLARQDLKVAARLLRGSAPSRLPFSRRKLRDDQDRRRVSLQLRGADRRRFRRAARGPHCRWAGRHICRPERRVLTK